MTDWSNRYENSEPPVQDGDKISCAMPQWEEREVFVGLTGIIVTKKAMAINCIFPESTIFEDGFSQMSVHYCANHPDNEDKNLPAEDLDCEDVESEIWENGELLDRTYSIFTVML